MKSILLVLLVTILPYGMPAQDFNTEHRTIFIKTTGSVSSVVQNAITAFAERIELRCPAKVIHEPQASLIIEIRIDNRIGDEGYVIESGTDHNIVISGNDGPGVLYGLGKLLHMSRYTEKGFTPGTWRGRSVPACTVRGVYMACHFNNYYETAPIEELEHYLEDLAFWGINAIVFNFPQWQYNSFDDPGARKNLDRIKQMMRQAKNAGIRVGLLEAENQGFNSAPASIRNIPFPDDWKRRGSLGTSICPAKPAGISYLMEFWKRLLNEFTDPGLDFIGFWPYDEGGCGCENCWPWGARGHLHLSETVAQLAKQKWPGCRMVLSTWMFDTPPAGEWEGLHKVLEDDSHLIDYIMADAHEDFPSYPLENPVPGGKPLLNFPEISMWGMSPWGGYGASPLPSRLQSLWHQVSAVVSGGFLYSEGIYEDMNKVIYSQFYWNPAQTAPESVKHYATAYFSPDVAESISEVVEILEKNHTRSLKNRMPALPGSTEKALSLMNAASERLSDRVRHTWRWRILFLRVLIDHALTKTEGRFYGPDLKNYFEELISIYHAQNVHTNKVAPPDMESGP